MNTFFADRLRGLIDKSDPHITQAQLAEIIGVSAGALSKYLSGDRAPTAEVLENCAAYFNVSTDYLLGISSFAPDNDQKLAVCSQTGLSLAALDSILALKDKRLRMALNDFLTSASLQDYLLSLLDIFSAAGNISVLTEELSHLCDDAGGRLTKEQKALLEDTCSALSAEIRDLRALTFQLSAISADIAEEAYAIRDCRHHGRQVCARAEEILRGSEG